MQVQHLGAEDLCAVVFHLISYKVFHVNHSVHACMFSLIFTPTPWLIKLAIDAINVNGPKCVRVVND